MKLYGYIFYAIQLVPMLYFDNKLDHIAMFLKKNGCYKIKPISPNPILIQLLKFFSSSSKIYFVNKCNGE